MRLAFFVKHSSTRSSGDKLADQIIAILMDDSIDARDDDLPELFRRMARIHERARRDLEIIKTYEALAKRIGMNDSIRGNLADWHRKMKRHPKAREILSEFDDKVAGLKQIASVWLDEKQPDQAIRIFDRLAKLAPEELAEWRQSVAEIFKSIGKYDEAIEVYKELITLAPTQNSTWYWTIGSIYEDTDRLKPAIQAYRRSDNYPKAYFQMAKCHRELKEYTEALTLYHQALATESAAPDATLAIGYTYEEQADKKMPLNGSSEHVNCFHVPKTPAGHTLICKRNTESALPLGVLKKSSSLDLTGYCNPIFLRLRHRLPW